MLGAPPASLDRTSSNAEGSGMAKCMGSPLVGCLSRCSSTAQRHSFKPCAAVAACTTAGRPAPLLPLHGAATAAAACASVAAAPAATSPAPAGASGWWPSAGSGSPAASRAAMYPNVYRGSPTSGCPSSAMWRRSWCFLRAGRRRNGIRGGSALLHVRTRRAASGPAGAARFPRHGCSQCPAPRAAPPRRLRRPAQQCRPAQAHLPVCGQRSTVVTQAWSPKGPASAAALRAPAQPSSSLSPPLPIPPGSPRQLVATAVCPSARYSVSQRRPSSSQVTRPRPSSRPQTRARYRLVTCAGSHFTEVVSSFLVNYT